MRAVTPSDAEWIRQHVTQVWRRHRRLTQRGVSAARAARIHCANDNLLAIGFYQKRGFSLVCAHVGAADEARRLKPSIPLIGFDGIPVRDDIELEMQLESRG